MTLTKPRRQGGGASLEKLREIAAPKPDDPRRCQSRINKGYEHLPREQRPFRCKRWASVGGQFCKMHSGGSVRVRMDKVPRLYRKMGRSLLARLDEMEQSGVEAMQLREELALQRVVADEVVMIYSIALQMKTSAEEKHATDPSNDGLAAAVIKARQLHDQAAQALNHALKNVRDTCLDAVKVEHMTSGRFTAEGVRTIMFKMVKIVSDVLGPENEAMALEIQAKIEQNIKVRADESGTTCTPDQDVRDMDDTVPA
jgi:hypothetical protein